MIGSLMTSIISMSEDSSSTVSVIGMSDELMDALELGVSNAALWTHDAISLVLPYALGICGVVMAVSIGYVIFRRFAH